MSNQEATADPDLKTPVLFWLMVGLDVRYSGLLTIVQVEGEKKKNILTAVFFVFLLLKLNQKT